jgi:hypothetical protein
MSVMLSQGPAIAAALHYQLATQCHSMTLGVTTVQILQRAIDLTCKQYTCRYSHRRLQ